MLEVSVMEKPMTMASEVSYVTSREMLPESWGNSAAAMSKISCQIVQELLPFPVASEAEAAEATSSMVICLTGLSRTSLREVS